MAIHALWRNVVTPDDLYGRTVGHIVMSYEDSIQTRSLLELQLVDLILGHAHGVPSVE
jgi:hypothetical protein